LTQGLVERWQLAKFLHFRESENTKPILAPSPRSDNERDLRRHLGICPKELAHNVNFLLRVHIPDGLHIVTTETRTELSQNQIVRLLLTDALEDALALRRRIQEVEPLNLYVHERMPAILVALLILFLISLGCLMGIFTLLPDMHWLFVLPILLLLPVILTGSLLVQVYVFFSWIEGRSMERALASRHKASRGPVANWVQQKLKVDLGPFPSVPWFLSTIFVLAPLVMLAYTWLPAAAAFIALAILMPVLYALYDR